MIDVHFTPTPNGHKVSIMLAETGLPHRLIPYDMLKGEHLTPEYRRINPNGRLPAIVDLDPRDGGAPFAVFETGAILIYLSERAGGAFLPTDPRRRSQSLQWLMWQMAGLGPMHGQAHHFVRYAPAGQDYAMNRYRAEATRLLGVLDRRLEKAEFLAEEYSIADMAVWPWVRAAFLIGVDTDGHAATARWLAAVGVRPAVQQAMEVRNAVNLGSERPVLTPEQWSNLFGENMLRSGERAAPESQGSERA